MKRGFLLLFILLAGPALAAQAQPCHQIRNHFSYCYYPGYGKQKNEILYFFHGVLGSQGTWERNSYYEQIRKVWKSRRSAPQVVTLSFGPFWLLTPQSSAPFSGKLDILTPNSLLEIERRHVKGPVERRWSIGESMGGHNLLQLHARYKNFFHHIYALCPAQFNKPLNLALQQLPAMANENEALLPWLFTVTKLMQSHYDENTWRTDSLFHLSDQLFKNLTRVHLVLVGKDNFGFTKMNYEWLRLARSKGAQISDVTLEGSHCDPQGLLDWFKD